jgi:hypothetical protein
MTKQALLRQAVDALLVEHKLLKGANAKALKRRPGLR